MFASLSKFIYRRRWAVLVAGLAFIVASGVYGTAVVGDLKSGGFDDPKAESTLAAAALHQKLGRDQGTLIVMFTAAPSAGLTAEQPDFRQAVEATLGRLTGQPGVGSITTFYNSGAAQLVSLDRRSTYAAVGLQGDEEAQGKYLTNLRPWLVSDKLQVRLGGLPEVNAEVSEQVSKDLGTAEMTTFPVVAVLLVLIFGSLVASALPLAVGGVAIVGAFLVLRLATNFTDVSIFALNIITMLGLGLAIDYSLFVVSRFREELNRHHGDVPAALTRTMQTAGRTVLFSGLTVAISLLSLLVFPLMFLRSMGLGGAAAVLIAMTAALTILPAALAVLGHRVNSLSIWSLLRLGRPRQAAPSGSDTVSGGFWLTTSRFVMRRPVTVLVLTLVPLIWVGLPFLRAEFATPDARSLPAGRDGRIVSEMLSTDFPLNETQPIQLVVRSTAGALEAQSLNALYDYTRQVQSLPGVTRVDSLVTLDQRLDKPAYTAFYAPDNRAANPQAAQAAARFAQGSYTLVSVLYESNPHSNQSQQLVKDLRKLNVPSGLSVEVGGNSAVLVDFLNSLLSSIPVAFGIVVAVVFLLLFLMLGSLVVPLKAVILNILSLSVSFGALVWIFQDGNLSSLLNFTPVGTIDGTQPILIFAIAFGLSMDYEVFLLSRIKEQYDRTGDTATSITFGIHRSGSIITSAAVLLFIVIGAFALGEIVFIKQIGVGLGLAVLVDATIVRMFLVPASMRLLGQVNWWAPAPLVRLYQRLGFSEVEQAEAVPAGEKVEALV